MELNIPSFLENGVIFSLNAEQVLVGWGSPKWEDTPTSSLSFFFPDYFLTNKKKFFTVDYSLVLSLQELENVLQQSPHPSPDKISWKNPPKEIFEKGFIEIKNQIATNELEKAVIYSALKADIQFTSKHLHKALLNLVHYAKNNHVYLHGYWEKRNGILGATPEILFKLCDNTSLLETMALAGTVPPHISEEEVCSNNKLIHEHGVVLKSLIDSLNHYGEVEIGPTKLLKLPHLSHFYAPLSVKLAHKPSFLSLVQDLHPTPALGAFPKKKGNEWLNSYNALLPRDKFGSPAGFIDAQNKIALCYVAIRNISWTPKEAAVFAGCGIVSQSDLDEEWEEVNLKMKSVCKILGFD